jgi:uncharacterized membrane protein
MLAVVWAVSYIVVQIVWKFDWFSNVELAAQVFPGLYLLNNLILLIHALTALPPLFLGPWGFLTEFQTKYRVWHRRLGQVYVICIFISSATGFVLAQANRFGPIAVAGFSTLAVVWFGTTYVGYVTIRHGDLLGHRRWMIRSYAITLAVLSVRLLPMPGGMTMAEWYPLKTWLCWVPNLILAELYVRVTDFKGRLVRALPRYWV